MEKKFLISLSILFLISVLYSEEVGNLFYSGDIGELKDSTILVSDEVVTMSSTVTVDIDTSVIDVIVDSVSISQYPNDNYKLDNFPLGDIQTEYYYKIQYAIAKDSILPNGDTIIYLDHDSMRTGTFSVIVDPSTKDPPVHYPNDFELIRWNRNLGFYYDGDSIYTIQEDMDTLELRFTYDPGDKDYHYTTVDIEIINNGRVSQDKESYKLFKKGYTFYGSFPRVVIKDNVRPNIGDGILQHYEIDSIAATFRNKEVPQLYLDTIRIAVPYKSSTAINPNSLSNPKVLSLNIINSSILFNLSNSGKTKLQIYNINGKLLSTLVCSYKQAGKHTVRLDSKKFGAGVYFIKLKANGSEVSRKVTVVR